MATSHGNISVQFVIYSERSPDIVLTKTQAETLLLQLATLLDKVVTDRKR